MLLETNLIHQHSPADAKIRLFRSLFGVGTKCIRGDSKVEKPEDQATRRRAVTNGFGEAICVRDYRHASSLQLSVREAAKRKRVD
jgi:hypothetical protein